MDQFWEFITNWLKGLLGLDLMLKALENNEPIPAQAWLNLVYSSLTLLLGVFVAYRFLYLILGVFGKSRTYKDAPQDKKYCFLLPARNEELVIANLIESIRKMDYPQELVDILVIADNCDKEDKTASIARELGAMVIERQDPNHKTKGYALEYALNLFKKDHDLENDYYAYIIMDADNIVSRDFLTKFNSCMQNSGFDEAVGYRNVKNLSENWVAAICGMNVYSTVVHSQRARSIFNANQQIYGTSLCMRSYLLKDGWKWVTLTEDIELQTDLTIQNYKTGYCEQAIFYEEEPTKVNLFVKQQMRWAKGGIIAFFMYSHKLVKSFFKKPSWSKYDMYWQIFPYALFTFYFALIYQIISLIFFGIFGDNGYSWMSFLTWMGTLFGGIYLSGFFYNLLTIIREWKMFHLNLFKTFIYLLLFPLYNVFSLPIAAVSVFMKVKWKHIDHHFVADADDLKAEELAKEKKKGE